MNGNSAQEAIKIESDVSQLAMKINKILAKRFGGGDGDFFIHSEQVIEDNNNNKRYKMYHIEDSNNKRQNVWFELI
jgi:hypothetical protein